MSPVPRKILTEAVRARLAELDNLTVYVRQIAPPPPTVSSDDLRVRPYTVIYPSTGIPFAARFCGTRGGLAWGAQVTCVAGDELGLDPVLDAVMGKLDGWRPVLASPYDAVRVERLRLAGDPGPSRRDDDVAPVRFYVPLYFALTAH